ncbi:MAG TPA: hypothetical protein VIR98_03555 [Candidatus Paceibacterota bacterium]|jgi:hypothetical protein
MNLQEIQLQFARILLKKETCDKYAPDSVLCSEEEIVGEIDDTVTRSLFSLNSRLTIYLDDFRTAHGLTSPSGFLTSRSGVKNLEHLEALVFHCNLASKLIQSVNHAFWFQVGNNFPQIGASGKHVSIRSGWIIAVDDIKRQCPTCFDLTTDTCGT